MKIVELFYFYWALYKQQNFIIFAKVCGSIKGGKKKQKYTYFRNSSLMQRNMENIGNAG